MAKDKKTSVEIDGKKYKDGDKVTVVITGVLRLDTYSWDTTATEVRVDYGDANEFYLNDAKDGKTQSVKGSAVVKH